MKNHSDRPSYEQVLEDLAAVYGIEPEYEDNWGRVQRTSAKTKENILKAIGVNVGTKAMANDRWHARGEGEWSRMTEPTIVATLSSLPNKLMFQVPVNPDAGSSPTQDLEVSLEVSDEHGIVRRVVFTSKELSFCGSRRIGSRTYERWSLPFPPLGTHGYYTFHLCVLAAGQQREQTVLAAICPDKAYLPAALEGGRRSAGIAISLYGVRSNKNWGIGDFGDLKQIVDWVVDDLHGGVIGVNPLHATFNRRPFNTSPYLPMSRFYRNFIYLNIPVMEDYQDSPEAKALVDAPETQRLLRELRASETVAYERVGALKQEVLREIFQFFLKNYWKRSGGKTDRQKALEGYIDREGITLDNFATFCALDSAMRSRDPEVWTWPQWPPEYRRPDTKAVQRFRREQWREVLFHKYVQWQLEEQLAEVQGYARMRGMGIGLYHDLALAIDRFSADFWAYQDFFIPKLRVGAPPDAFSQHGQDWGFPPPNMEKFRETRYDLFVKEIRKNCAFGGALRIDHVMRFFHLYCIPGDEPPTKGAYLSQPFEDLIRIVALETVRNQVVVIGEDLGTVPGYIRDILKEANILSYRLLYFEKDNQQDFLRPQDYPESALVTVTTHDLPTLAGFWSHRDIEVRKEAGMFDSQQAPMEAAAERRADKKKLLELLQQLHLLPGHCSTEVDAYPEITGELHNAVVGFLASTPAKLFVLSLEDLFKETDQQNFPGTTAEYPNWSLKLKYTLEEFRSDPKVKAFCRMFRDWIDKSGRSQSTSEL